MIGRSLTRVEAKRLLVGRGKFVDDVAPENAVYAAFIRSPHAHATIDAIRIEPALAMPGVLAVPTGKDWLAAGLGRSPGLWLVTSRDGTPMNEVCRPMIVDGRVRHVGDTVAVVIAEARDSAQDAAARVEIDYEILPAAIEAVDAVQPDAPRVHEEFDTNQVFDWEIGDAAATDAAFAGAAHVTALELLNNRLAPSPIEPRAVVGLYEAASDHYTLWTTSQNPHLVRRWLAESSLFIAEHNIRVVAPDVGGGFGQKIYHYPEEAVVLWASKIVGRPVRWTASRSESFTVDTHARDHATKCEMAFDADGRILGVRADTIANLGAYLSPFAVCIPSYFYATMLPGIYTMPTAYGRVRAVYTHTTPVDAYRGAGRPECLYVVERLLENGGREMGIDICELRRRNLIQADQFPYTTATGVTYDSGDLPQLLTKATALADYDGLRAEQAQLRSQGILMGIGMAGFVDCAGAGPSKVIAAQGARMGFWDVANVRVHPSGKVSVFCGSHSHGQGHATTYSQIVADRLGCAIEDIAIVEGDTDRIPFGLGTWASRSISVIGAAIAQSLDRIVEKSRELAAHLLECGVEDVEFTNGAFIVTGTDRRIAFPEVVHAAYSGATYPEGFELGLDETVFYDPANYNFPSAFHICTVLVDADSGNVTLRDYFAADDVGRVINPSIVAGQIHGGLAQGIGQALMESCAYDRSSGQLLTGSFMDYAMPRASDMPPIALTSQETLAPDNPLGVKGAGESGTIGAPSAVTNAVVDALWHLGVRHIEMPLTAMRVWQAIKDAPG